MQLEVSEQIKMVSEKDLINAVLCSMPSSPVHKVIHFYLILFLMEKQAGDPGLSAKGLVLKTPR